MPIAAAIEPAIAAAASSVARTKAARRPRKTGGPSKASVKTTAASAAASSGSKAQAAATMRMYAMAPREGPSSQPAQGPCISTSDANAIWQKAASASGALRRYRIRLGPLPTFKVFRSYGTSRQWRGPLRPRRCRALAARDGRATVSVAASGAGVRARVAHRSQGRPRR